MAPQKTDKRRADLVVPYKHVPQQLKDNTAFMSSTLPIGAMFMRNKLLAWASLFTSIQTFLNEPINKADAASSQPAWVSLATSVISIATCYMDFVLPNMRQTGPRGFPGQAAPAQAPPASTP